MAVKLNVAHITDEIVYDEEQLIQTLWKLVIPSGTVFVSSIWSTDWFWYMVKEFGFENKAMYRKAITLTNQLKKEVSYMPMDLLSISVFAALNSLKVENKL